MSYSKTLRVTVDLIMRVNPFTGMTLYKNVHREVNSLSQGPI